MVRIRQGRKLTQAEQAIEERELREREIKDDGSFS